MKTHCVNGHPLTNENIIFVNNGKNKPRKRKCRICINNRRRRYRERIRDRMRLKGKVHAKTFYSKHSEQVKTNIKDYRQTTKNTVFNHYGAKCACCGETIREFLCVDHINGNGNKHRREVTKGGGGVTFYRWLIKNNFPEGFQILCFNCNFAKSTHGICPHKK